MSSHLLPELVAHYLNEVATREADVQKQLRAETAKMQNSRMQVTPDQGAFLAMLVKLIGAKQVLEVGTFTGYSALAMALALPDNGVLHACDSRAEWVAVGQPYWQQAGIADKINLHIGKAAKTLAAFLNQGMAETFDLAFIDADKPSYDEYYERSLELLRPGGLIVLDNMLWGGTVADPNDDDEFTVMLRNLNAKIRDDHRVDASFLAVADGVMLARKR